MADRSERDSTSGLKPPLEWDDDWAKRLIGQYALVGVTYYEADGKTECGRYQYHGRITNVDRHKGIKVACEGRWQGKTMILPPSLAAFELAKPGRYTLKSTGEVIDDPDVLVSWGATKPRS